MLGDSNSRQDLLPSNSLQQVQKKSLDISGPLSGMLDTQMGDGQRKSLPRQSDSKGLGCNV